MLRKNIRLKKEFLYKKEQERQSTKQEEAKAKSKMKGTENKMLLKADDEYTLEEYKDPQILLTTSRDPSTRLLKFFKEMGLTIPNCARMNRGSYTLKDIVSMCMKRGFSDLVLLHEHRGEPNGLIVSHLPHGPTLYMGLGNCILRHDIEGEKQNIRQAPPHLVFDNFGGKIGPRIQKILQHLFPITGENSKRLVSFICNKVVQIL